MLLYLIILLGFVVGFLYNSQSDPTASVPQVDARYQLTSLRGLDRAHVDSAIMQTEQFKELRVFGQLPVRPTAGGKDNPFQ